MHQVTIHFRTGFYTGDLFWGVPHGTGCWTTNLFKYEGEFVCGKRHGKGRLTWLHDRFNPYFKGVFQNDEMYDGHDTYGRLWQKGVLYDTFPSVKIPVWTEDKIEPTEVKALEIKPLEVKPRLSIRKPLAKKMVSMNPIRRSRNHPRKQKLPRRSPVI
jgi:hypothetical protein